MTRPRRGRGQALAEFALVVPIFVLLLFGIIDLGRYVFTANALNNGAREAARFAGVGVRPAICDGLTREACATAVATGNSWGVPPATITVTTTCQRELAVTPIASCRTGDLLMVRTETSFTLVTPLIAQLLGSQTIAGESKVTVNQ